MRPLKIKKLLPVLMLLLETFFLVGCVPRSDQENSPSSIPFRVTLLPLANTNVSVNQTIEIQMDIQNTTTKPVEYLYSGWSRYLFINHYDENGSLTTENDLSIKQGSAGIRIYPSFYQEFRPAQLPTTFPAGAVEHAKFKVVFSQSGTHFIQGAIRIRLPSGAPGILTEVIILSPEFSLSVNVKK